MEWNFPSNLQQIEEILRSVFLQKDILDCQVRTLVLQGEPGQQTLTIQLDLPDLELLEPDAEAKQTLESLSKDLRNTGYVVDELWQNMRDGTQKPCRYWLIAYDAQPSVL